MFYVVMVRSHVSAPWEPFAEPCDDPFTAMSHIQAAGKHHAEVTVLQATDAEAVKHLLAQARAGATLARQSSPVPSLTSTPRVHVEESSIDRRRWEIEQGRGGDHDCAYVFTLPQDARVLAKWLDLMLSLRVSSAV